MTLRVLLRACAIAVLLAMPGQLAGQEPVAPAAEGSLTAARELYASAEYKGALAMLDNLLAAGPSPQERSSIELHRIFCLVAVGSADEATRAIEAMIVREPLYRPDMDELPPRLRTTFGEARRRLLPAIIQNRYVLAKGAFDRGDFKEASEGFTQVLVALSDPDIAPAAGQSPLADLRVLAAGFNDLTVRAMAPPPPPPQPAIPAPAPAPAPRPADAPLARVPTIHTADEPNVVQPVVLRQDVPPFPRGVAVANSGVLEIVISETGAVEAATIREPLDPLYSRLLLAAARNWAYRPARLDGVPVKFVKRIQINLTANP